MSETVRYSRGTSAISKADALRKGLALYNNPFGRKNPARPAGAYFRKNLLNRWSPSGENFANIAERIDHTVPVVLDLTITPKNFSLLAGRIHFVLPGETPGEEIYIPAQKFGDFTNFRYPQDEVTIDLSELSHEDLIRLGINVGFRREGTREFDYKTYEEWSQALGFRAKTREELIMSTEGNYLPSQMRR